MSKKSKFSVSDPIKVTTDYRQDIWRMIAIGNYDSVRGYINVRDACHDLRDSEENEIVLVCFGLETATSKILVKVKHQGLRLATFAEALSLGAQYPDLQRKHPIVAMGSRWRDSLCNTYAPALVQDDRKRELEFVPAYPKDGWPGHWMFACVGKQ